MSKVPGRWITYCTNIHPGESWRETFAAVQRHVPVVKAAVSPDFAFPIGLRLSRQAANEITGAASERFGRWLQDSDCFVPTINGFPYGAFHGERIKERVYLPDWRSPDRAAYTIVLANLLAQWLPRGMIGSISTVPIGFKDMLDERDFPLVKRQLVAVLTHLEQIRQRAAREIVLSLEPEPGCLLETTEQVCRFFAALELPAELGDLIGVCFDCCHQAVEFEESADSLKRLAEAGIRIAKVQVASALRLFSPNLPLLGRFNEPRYLHQVVVRRRDGSLHRYNDVPQALAEHEMADDDEWRCHFHLPIFVSGAHGYGTTRFFLESIVPRLPGDVLLEIETYTWEVLPSELRCETMGASIIREIRWLQERFIATHGRT